MPGCFYSVWASINLLEGSLGAWTTLPPSQLSLPLPLPRVVWKCALFGNFNFFPGSTRLGTLFSGVCLLLCLGFEATPDCAHGLLSILCWGSWLCAQEFIPSDAQPLKAWALPAQLTRQPKRAVIPGAQISSSTVFITFLVKTPDDFTFSITEIKEDGTLTKYTRLHYHIDLFSGF